MHQNNADLIVLLSIRKIRADRAATLLMDAERGLKIANDLQVLEKSKVTVAEARVVQRQSERQSFTNKYVAGYELKKRNELLVLAKADLEDARKRHMESLKDLHRAQSKYEYFLIEFRKKQKILIKTEVILEEVIKIV